MPDFAKPLLRPVYERLLRRWLGVVYALPRRSVSELHDYWRSPPDAGNRPEAYLDGEARSQFLLGIVARHADREASVLEVGCNVGRNLHFLFRQGYRDLSGIEISSAAVELLRESYPEMGRHATIYNAPVQEVVRDLQEEQFDVVFTMAVLQHLHPSSRWVFGEMVRITRRVLITIEDESLPHWRQFPRNYQKVFESLGMRQVEATNCAEIAGLGRDFNARVFAKGRREA